MRLAAAGVVAAAGGAWIALQLGPDYRNPTVGWLRDRLALPDELDAQLQSADDERAPEALAAIDQWLLGLPRTRGLPYDFIAYDFDPDAHARGVFSVRGVEVPLETPIAWSQPDRGRTFHAELHSWRYLPPLLERARTVGDSEMRSAAEAILVDWIRQNPYPGGAHLRAWHEGAVVKRLIVLVYLLDYARVAGPSEQVPPHALAALLWQHAHHLVDEDVYLPSNHGLRQDLALLAASVGSSPFQSAPDWRRLALQRLEEEQIRRGFSPEGVRLEHSPGYHQYVAILVEDVIRLLKANDVPEELSWLDRWRDQSNRYLAHVLTPSGEFPPVGDTDLRDPASRMPIQGPEMRFTVSRGLEGTPPGELDGWYPEAGQAISRETWGETPAETRDSFYVMLQAAFHPAYPEHRQADALSPVVFGRGRWWLIDHGKYNYEDTPLRAYVISQQAHNAYTVDGECLPPLARKDLNAALEEPPLLADDVAAYRARSARYAPEGTAVRRTLVFLRRRPLVLLLDDLDAPDHVVWRRHFHLASDLDCETGGLRVTATPSGQGEEWLVMDLISSAADVSAPVIVRGRTEPTLLGWTSPARGERAPCPTVVYSSRGPRLHHATLLSWRSPDRPPPDGLRLEVTESAYLARWREGDEEAEVRVAREGRPDVSTRLPAGTVPAGGSARD